MKNNGKEGQPKVFIRVDGGLEIGLGHLVRCLALGHMIKKEFDVHFFLKEVPEKFTDQFLSGGFQFTVINAEEDFLKASEEAEIIVLDLLKREPFVQEEFKNRGPKVVVVDDLHSGTFSADLIINHAPGIVASDYNAAYNTEFALGLEFALLRPRFLKEASSKIERSSNLEQLFICFGGSDNLDLTRRSLEIAIANPFFKSINVVVGNAYSRLEDLKALSSSHDNVRIHHNIDEEEMIAAMKDSGLAIVPASGILLEVLTIGLSAISGMYVPNQKFFYQNYKEKGLIIDAEDFSEDAIASAIETALKGSTGKTSPIDGHSGSRILKHFRRLVLEDQVDLQPAKPKDLEITFKWATSPAVRAFSFSQEEITYEEHKSWFSQKLKSRETLFLIAWYKNKPVGSVRFDDIKNKPVISYLIDPDYHGLGLGSTVLKKGVEVLKRVQPSTACVEGMVLAQNIPSIKIFERLGYEKETTHNNGYRFVKKLK